jgi:GGDEF domain-containing protein
VPAGLLSAGRADLAAIEPIVASVYRIAVSRGGLADGGARVPTLNGLLTVRSASLSAVLTSISRTDDANAASSDQRTKLGSAAAMLLLLAAFAYFYFRSVAARRAVQRLGREKEDLLGISRGEARTDTLGHAAGDSLLQRLGGWVAAAAAAQGGSAYRMGGDEFCLLTRCRPEAAERLLDETIGALQDSGEGWHVGCSHGARLDTV